MTLCGIWCPILPYCRYSRITDTLEIIWSQQTCDSPIESVFLKLINRKNILPLWKGKTPVVIYSMLCSCSIILYGGKCWIRDTFLLRDGNYWFVIWCGVVADKAVSKGYMLCVAMLWNCFPHLPLAPLPRWTWEEGDLFKGCAMKYKWQEINHLSAHVSLPAQR